MTKKISATIAITAYNEEANIKHVLMDLINQSGRNYSIKNMLVVSDGSTDKTAEHCKEFKQYGVICLEYKKRMGKPYRINQIFRKINTDVVILFDADIRMKSKFVIERLIAALNNDKRTELVSGNQVPAAPRSLFEHILNVGNQMFTEAKKISGSGLYLCNGAIRLYKKSLYKKINIPQSSSEDVYPYLYCLSKGIGFKFVGNAEIIFRLPGNLADYLKQSRRYLKSKTVHMRNFNPSLVKSAYNMTLAMKIAAFKKIFFNSPILSVLYLCVLLLPKLLRVVDKNKKGIVKWDLVVSSKTFE